MSTAVPQRVMTASEVLTWIAFRKPEPWSRADPRMKFFAETGKAPRPSEDEPTWPRLMQLLAEADAELLHAVSENREPVYGSDELQAAAEANQLNRERRRKLDDAAEELRQACAAGDVTPTGRQPAEWGKPSASSHEAIPAIAFSGSDRTIKADGRLLDTLNGRSRVLWQSLEFRTDQTLAVWQSAGGRKEEIEAEYRPKEVILTEQKTSKHELREWYIAKRDRWKPGMPVPSLRLDLEEVKERFGAEYRSTLKDLRHELAPDEWNVKIPGRKKNAQ